jgi:hypothetical protein
MEQIKEVTWHMTKAKKLNFDAAWIDLQIHEEQQGFG